MYAYIPIFLSLIIFDLISTGSGNVRLSHIYSMYTSHFHTQLYHVDAVCIYGANNHMYYDNEIYHISLSL